MGLFILIFFHMFFLVLTIMLLFTIATRKEDINRKLNELAGNLTTIGDVLNKVAIEVQALKDALVNVELPAEAQVALDNLSAQAKALDDLNPDA